MAGGRLPRTLPQKGPPRPGGDFRLLFSFRFFEKGSAFVSSRKKFESCFQWFTMVSTRGVYRVERFFWARVFRELRTGCGMWAVIRGPWPGVRVGGCAPPGPVAPRWAGPLFGEAHGASYTVVPSLGKASLRKNFSGGNAKEAKEIENGANRPRVQVSR